MKEEGKREKKEAGRKKEEGRRKKEEGRRRKKEGRRNKKKGAWLPPTKHFLAHKSQAQQKYQILSCEVQCVSQCPFKGGSLFCFYHSILCLMKSHEKRNSLLEKMF